MCLGVPAKVIEIDKDMNALVDIMGAKMKVGIIFVPDVQIGNFVLLHAGQAMTIIDEQYAEESISEWRKVLDV